MVQGHIGIDFRISFWAIGGQWAWPGWRMIEGGAQWRVKEDISGTVLGRWIALTQLPNGAWESARVCGHTVSCCGCGVTVTQPAVSCASYLSLTSALLRSLHVFKMLAPSLFVCIPMVHSPSQFILSFSKLILSFSSLRPSCLKQRSLLKELKRNWRRRNRLRKKSLSDSDRSVCSSEQPIHTK